MANLGRFVFPRPLGQDFYRDRELDWRPLSAAARDIVTAGSLGKLDGRRHGHFLRELDAEGNIRSVEQVSGA